MMHRRYFLKNFVIGMATSCFLVLGSKKRREKDEGSVYIAIEDYNKTQIPCDTSIYPTFRRDGSLSGFYYNKSGAVAGG